jgi:hypothetical protein
MQSHRELYEYKFKAPSLNLLTKTSYNLSFHQLILLQALYLCVLNLDRSTIRLTMNSDIFTLSGKDTSRGRASLRRRQKAHQGQAREENSRRLDL